FFQIIIFILLQPIFHVRMVIASIPYQGRNVLSTMKNSFPERDMDTNDDVRGSKRSSKKRSLVDLPEDLLVIIIPHLGLADRFNVAVTCHRLYDAEAKSGKSNMLTYWNRISVRSGVGIILYREKLDECGMPCKDKQLSLKTADSVAMFHALKRVLRTATTRVLIKLTLDLADPAQQSILEAFYNFEVSEIIIDQTVPFSGEIPNAFLRTMSNKIEHLFVWKTQIDVDNIECFYEHIKLSSVKDATITVLKSQAAIFVTKVMGIANFSFSNQNSNLTTTKDNVFYVEHREHKYILVDGETETMVYRSSNDTKAAYIIIKKSPIMLGMIRIPVVDPSVAQSS
ncbi:hypothetical protein PMAYCL1PPCAC_05726, partial [Pristionchus mayeri]